MGFLTAVTDVQDSTGATIVVNNADGTRPPIVIKLGAGLSGSFVKSGDQGIVTVTPDGTAPVSGSSLNLGAQTPPQWQGTAYASQTFTDSAAHTLATLAVPAGGNIDLEFRVIATLAPGQTNSNLGPAIYRIATFAGRVASGAPQAGLVKDTSDTSPPFRTFAAGSMSAGRAGVVFSGNNVLIQVQGFPIKEAWTSGHTYAQGDGASTVGEFVTSGGNVYLCTTGGVAGATPPSGTGTGISDGTDVWAYICAGSTVPVRWTLVIIPGLFTG